MRSPSLDISSGSAMKVYNAWNFMTLLFFYLPRSSPLFSMFANLHIRELNVPRISSEGSLNPLIPSSCHSISTSWLLPHLLAALSHLALNSPAVFPRLKWAFLLLALWLLRWADFYQGPWHGPETCHLLTDSSWHPWLHLGSAHSHSSKFIWESQNLQCMVLISEMELKCKDFCISVLHI